VPGVINPLTHPHLTPNEQSNPPLHVHTSLRFSAIGSHESAFNESRRSIDSPSLARRLPRRKRKLTSRREEADFLPGSGKTRVPRVHVGSPESFLADDYPDACRLVANVTARQILVTFWRVINTGERRTAAGENALRPSDVILAMKTL